MLKNKVVLITGASSGIGRAMALVCAREGASVVVSDIDEAGAEATAELVREVGNEALVVNCDIGQPTECEQLVARCCEHFGRLDVACNNAGISGPSQRTADYPLQAWAQVIQVNLSGVFYCMKYEIEAMLRNGGGSIVNVASILGAVGFATAPAYAAAKHGVVGLTHTAALEYATDGIRINAVGPGFIRTPMISALDGDAATHAMLVASHPMGRLGEAEEVAELMVWLASSRAAFVTGAYYPVDGGYLAR